MNNILVLGGTGFVGNSVCDKLVTRSGGAGGRIVVPTRFPGRVGSLQALPTVEIVRADVHDDATLRRLLRGKDAVIQLIAILHGRPAEFQRAHVEFPKRLADACAACGVKRMIHVSALGAGENSPALYQRTKAAGEAALKQAPLDLTIARPSVIFGEHDHFLNLFARLQRIFPVMPLAGANAKFQPVWVEDVAQLIVQSLDNRTTIGQTIECTGPQVYTLRQLVAMAGLWSGHPRPIIGLPHAVGRLQAALLELLPGAPLMSRDNVDAMKIDNVASGTLPGLTNFGIRPRSVDSVMPGLLAGTDGPARLDPWRTQAGRR
ncbi:complex I NDUFA9 subunit family protein [Piscinibacter terrae]|uniref:Complex I NDUFA9 subunit family protein n=1 Tax=Piscinibacter terrae TaxID=2496871 RepID=A0A3N7HWA9_9BURK|nr:complex I NDUFA9 subunit family protein [Albitalea terrae]RQP26607.1 complex I NDUFA9 subunit family protein [Albitalea terrae]